MITNTELTDYLKVVHERTGGEYQIENARAQIKIGTGEIAMWQPAVTYRKLGDGRYEQLFIRDAASFMKSFQIKNEKDSEEQF